jgi:predicted Zn-dependent protease
MKNDSNICEHCTLRHPIDAPNCSGCGQPLVLDAKGRIAIWRLGDVEDSLLDPLAAAVRRAFFCSVVIQPGFVDARPSLRPTWNGRSATVLINQMHARRTRGVLANLCVTEDNITFNKSYNFLFGLAWLGLGAAAMGIKAMRFDEPDTETLVARMSQIAVHELGHAFGLDDRPYGHAECVMSGEVEEDSIESIDAGTIRFCKDCRSQLNVSGG